MSHRQEVVTVGMARAKSHEAGTWACLGARGLQRELKGNGAGVGAGAGGAGNGRSENLKRQAAVTLSFGW